jgi:DNA repair protein RAD50
MTATRNIQLTVKKTTRQQKTLEGNLAMARNGERTSISTRVAELDQLLPRYFGVSKAILDSVIFCHQDESLWPMSEPAALKKRFDEIFEAQKYTKAIDNIKVLRKKQVEELAKFKLMEAHSKEDKVKAEKAEKQRNQLSNEMEKLREEIRILHEKAETAKKKAQTAWEHASEYTAVIEKLKSERKHKEWYEKQLESLANELQERPESDEWLQRELAQYEERVVIHQNRLDEQTERYTGLQGNIKELQQNQSNQRIEAGKLEQLQTNHESRIRERAEEIRASASEHNIHGYDAELDDMQINQYMETITKLSKDQHLKVERLKSENQREVRKVQEVLDQLREKRSALQEARKSAKQQISNNERKISTAHSKLQKSTIDEAGVAIIKGNIEELETKIQSAKNQLAESGSDAKIRELNKELQELDDRESILSRELIEGTTKAADLARLDHLKKEVKDRKRKIDSTIGAHRESLNLLMGESWKVDDLEATFQRLLQERKYNVSAVQKQRDIVSRELEQTNFKIRTSQSEIKKREKEIEKCTDFINEKTGSEPQMYPEELAAAHADREVRQRDVDSFLGMQDFFMKAIEIARHDKKCRLCKKGLRDKKEIDAFVTALEGQFSEQRLQQMSEALQEAKEDVEKVESASSSYEIWKRLSEKELPPLEDDLKKVQQQREQLLRKLEVEDEKVKEAEEEQREAELLGKPVLNLHKYNEELVSLEAQVKAVSAEEQESGSSRSLEDIQDDIDKIKTKAKDARSRIAKLQNEVQHAHDQINNLIVELGNAKTKLSTANHELQEKASINNEISELKKANQELKQTMTNLDDELQELSPEFTEQQTKLKEAQRTGAEREKELQVTAQKLADDVRSLMRADYEIQEYIRTGGAAKLARCRRDIQAQDSEISSLEAEQKQLTIEINKIKEELGNQDHNKRIITDNLNFRKIQRDLEHTEKEINLLVNQNAEADQEHYRQEASRWERQHELASTERTSKMGTMKAKDDQLAQLLQDYETDYKDAAQKYRKAHIEVETTKAAIEDLARYGGALDKAIMKYHSLKMEQINRSIEELWRATYQGTDVDTILIRSDNESGKSNRSYNYRVCMVKQDVEMDMRGRCSAGQKVLASIIIRLALAECFGEYCGLIALDEPTTNLDRDNIRSLAESLHGIIRQRQSQSNFQLIVITHDEEFLKYMKCADFCDKYYRVTRDARQKSEIFRQDISQVM